MNTLIELPYFVFVNTFKKFHMKTRYVELPEKYILRAWDDLFLFGTEISKQSETLIKNHFETNYKSNFDMVETNIAGAFNTQLTGQVIYNPSDTKRFVISSYLINIRNNTLGAQTVQVFDGTNSGNTRLINLSLSSGSEQNVSSSSAHVYVSDAVNNNLMITTSGAIIVNGRFKIYEVF